MKPYFYLIEIDKKVQHKITSTNLTYTFSPCFMNGDPIFCIVGGNEGRLEVWDVQKRTLVRLLKVEEENSNITALTSLHNILAVGTTDSPRLSLWNSQKWEKMWTEDYDLQPVSVQLTNDLKYLVIGGVAGEKGIVLSIK